MASKTTKTDAVLKLLGRQQGATVAAAAEGDRLAAP